MDAHDDTWIKNRNKWFDTDWNNFCEVRYEWHLVFMVYSNNVSNTVTVLQPVLGQLAKNPAHFLFCLLHSITCTGETCTCGMTEQRFHSIHQMEQRFHSVHQMEQHFHSIPQNRHESCVILSRRKVLWTITDYKLLLCILTQQFQFVFFLFTTSMQQLVTAQSPTRHQNAVFSKHLGQQDLMHRPTDYALLLFWACSPCPSTTQWSEKNNCHSVLNNKYPAMRRKEDKKLAQMTKERYTTYI